MTIDEAGKRRAELERQVAAVLRDFEEASGLSVVGVGLIHNQAVGRKPELVNVRLNVELWSPKW